MSRVRGDTVTSELRFDNGNALVHAVKTEPANYEWGTTYCLMYFSGHMEAPSRYVAHRVFDVVTCFGCIAAAP